MRVCYLTMEYPPTLYGGAGVHVAQLTRAISRLGTEVEVRTSSGGQATTIGGLSEPPKEIRVSRLPYEKPREQGPGRVLAVLDWGRRLAAEPYEGELVHGHTWYCAQPTNWLAQLSDVPSVLTVHSLEPARPWKARQLGEEGHRLSTWLERVGLQEVDHIITVSQAMAEDLQRYYHIKNTKTTVIPNGVDTGAFYPHVDEDVLDRWGIVKPYLLFVGRLTQQKGLDVLLEALPHLDPDMQVVVCTGAADGSTTAGRLKELTKASPRLLWLDRDLDLVSLRTLYSAATVYCCPSRYEPFGITNLEALACGTPVVASDVGGIRDVVGEAGLLVEPEDPQAMAEAANQLLRDEELHERAVMVGAEQVQRFTWPNIALQTLELYRKLIN